MCVNNLPNEIVARSGIRTRDTELEWNSKCANHYTTEPNVSNILLEFFFLIKVYRHFSFYTHCMHGQCRLK